MNQKKGAMPVILLLIGCMLLTLWVWKQERVDLTELELAVYDLDSLLAKQQPVLLNVSSDDCPYCVMMEPELQKLYQQYGNVAVIADLNIDRCPEAAVQLPVRATPMQVLFTAKGEPYQPSEVVQQQMGFVYWSDKDSGDYVLTVHEGMLTAQQMELLLQDMGVAP